MKAIKTVHVFETGNVVCMVIIENVTIPIRRVIDSYCCKRIGIIENNVNKSHIDKHDMYT